MTLDVTPDARPDVVVDLDVLDRHVVRLAELQSAPLVFTVVAGSVICIDMSTHDAGAMRFPADHAQPPRPGDVDVLQARVAREPQAHARVRAARQLEVASGEPLDVLHVQGSRLRI